VELLYLGSLRSKLQLLNLPEFYALAVAGDVTEWLSCFLRDLPLRELQGAITIFCDNQTASAVAANSLFNGKKRTIRLKHGYINELISHRVISVIDVRSSDNIADPLTKGLKKDLVEKASAGISL
jgi:histone deacetylase 1/2